MNDVISRQAVLDTLDNMDNVLDEDRTIENYKELLKECYEVLPSVNPTKTGHWIDTNSKSFELHRVYKCSECGTTEIEYPESIYRLYRYCPNCSAKMVEPQESEDKG